MTNYIILLVGKSGTGKTTVADILERDYDMTQLRSYTTRQPRYPDEGCHTFVSDEEFDALEHKVAYTEYDEARYCATAEQVDNSDIYVIDPAGLDTFDKHYNGAREPVVIYLEASRRVRKQRMLSRGDSGDSVKQRLQHDRKAFRFFQYHIYDQIENVIPINTEDQTPEQIAARIAKAAAMCTSEIHWIFRPSYRVFK